MRLHWLAGSLIGPSVDGIGPVLRVASWNIERGLNFDLIRLALSDPDGFQQAALQGGMLDTNKQARIDQQLRTLRDADIVVLNEVDLGMKRTDYRDVTRDLAHVLGMNYVFGVEFIEVDGWTTWVSRGSSWKIPILLKRCVRS